MTKYQPAKSPDTLATESDPAEVDNAILNAVRGIRFGSVEIVIHDGKVVQIESKERVRFAPRQGGSK